MPIMTLLFNKTFQSGLLPKIWRIAWHRHPYT